MSNNKTNSKKGNPLPMHEISEVPTWHSTAIPVAHITLVVFTKKLHTHHSEYKDDDAEHKRKIRQRSHCVHHNGQDVVKRLPRFGEFENS